MRQLSVILFTLCLSVVMRAQTTLPVSPVTSTEGYDFVATFLPNGSSLIDAADLKLQFIVSSREVPGHSEITENIIAVQYADGSFGPDVRVPVGTTQEITIEPSNIKKAYWDITKDEVEKVLNKGVHLYSKNGVKMTVYAVNQIGTDKSTFSLDGAHVLPKQALGHEYIVACNSEDVLASEFVIMSTAAGTTVNIKLPSDVKTSTGKAELTATFDKAYQMYIVRSQPADPKDPTVSMDLSGTTICADHPVAVWGGNQAARFTTDQPNASADHAFDQLLPIDRWGTQFIIPMTGLNTRLNEVDVIARDDKTKVTITSFKGTENKELQAFEKWPRLVDAYHGQEGSFNTVEDSVLVVKADKPVQVYLYTSSSVYNVDRTFKYQGDPSMTMITPLEQLTDTAVFATFKNPQKDAQQMKYELMVWAKKSTIPSLKRNGVGINASLFKNLPGSVYSNYQYARIPIEDGYQMLTAAEKGFGGYVYGLEDGQACLFPVGYDITPVEDSLFLSKKYEPKDVHGADFKNTYPDRGNGGGWYLDKVVLPNIPTQYDTIFVCDSSKLRFPALLRNQWDDIKWEVMRIDPSSKKRTEYTDDGTARQTGTLANPFLETQFFVLPEKNTPAGRRHPYEDFEVRAVLYRKPVLCDLDQEKWQKDTLSTIVRTYRSYNDTTWLIRCDNDGDLKFFINPVTKEAEVTPLSLGENGPFTRTYSTVNGCDKDSTVTLFVLLCHSDVEVRSEQYLCEEELEGIHSQLGDFFQTFDFAGTLKACKKSMKNDNGWTYLEAKQLWQFKGKDVIRTTDCNSEMQRWQDKYGASFPRSSIGCDRSLEITLLVWPEIEYEYWETTCQRKYTWHLQYNWVEESKRFTKEIDIDYTLGKDGIHQGTNECVYRHKKSTVPPGTGFTEPCYSERHILHLTFLTDNDTHVKPKEMCQDDAPLVVSKKSDPDIADETFEWIFDPKEHEPGEYYSDKIDCVNDENCPYYMQYKVTINPVDVVRDTVVYCYDDGSQVLHKWEGHPKFWAQIKNQPNTRRRYTDANNPLKINRPKADKTQDTRVIYELADTIFGTPCHTIYYQTVILLPPYSTSDKRAPISTKQWFEWLGVIWAGDKVNPDTIPNPSGLPIVILQEYGRVSPEGGDVEYLKGDYLYALTTTTTTHQYKRADGTLTATCDSTVQLLVQVADEQEEYTYAYTCSSDTPYVWQAGDTTIHLNLREYQDPKQLPKTIHLEEHRKTVASLWPVAGIDAHFYRDLTIYPSYLMAVDDHQCQNPGQTAVFKGITFSLDKADTLVSGNQLKTEPKIWKNPDTGEEVEVRCDSGEVVRMFVHPIYTETVNKELSTYQRTFYSHDTVSFFTDPKVLFVGKDFLLTHPEIKSLDELKRIAKVDSALVITADLLPEMGIDAARGGIFHTQQVSDGTHGRSCDSTTFLDITVQKANVLPLANLGDNGDVLDEGATEEWKFGGDTTVARADGTRYHTCPLITGDYFHYYYDKDGNIIGEVDYFDPDDDPNNRRSSKDYHYSENNDGTRTYLLIDTVLNADGSFSVYVQNLIVYPTYLVSENIDGEAVEVCASDTYVWEGHYDKYGNVFKVDVSTLDMVNRKAVLKDTLCAKRYTDRMLCVDSICLLDLTVFGNANVPQTRHQCFNDTIWKWNGKEIYYDADAPISGQIRDTIKPKDFSDNDCYDVYVLNVIFDKAYGVAPYAGNNLPYQKTYIEPYNYDTTTCRFDEDFHWLLSNGEEHIPSNLYLYEYKTGIPDNRYIDPQSGNATNKIPGNKIPTDLDFGLYTVRDSLKTVGCYCDSVLTLNYEIIEAMPPQQIEATICKGEVYQFGDTTLTEPGTYERYIQEEGKPCKTKTTLILTVEKLTSIAIDPAPVCFGEANTESSYAMRYSYKGNHPSSFSVYYKDDAKEIGFTDINDQPINRPSSEWKADSVYVLNLPLPVLETREDYPTPGVYHATISFKNEVCSGSSLMTFDFDVKVNYPAWVMEQRHGDLIVLLDSAYNGGHAWKGFQWYRNGQKMFGYTKPYLYVPEGLIYESEQTAEYHVVLTETDAMGKVISSEPTCTITVQAMPNSPTNPDKDHGPSSDYIAVTPTCVPRGGSIHILSLNENSSGEYRINTVDGQFVSKGEYNGKSTPVSIPSVEGMYIVQVWSSNKESKESYRAIKVIVKDTCPNCDKSSF